MTDTVPVPEIVICKSTDVEATGGGSYMTFSLPSFEEQTISYFQEKTVVRPDFRIPKWDKWRHKRFEYFSDIYLAAITALLFFPFKLTFSIPHGQEISLSEHLNRNFPGTNWPTFIVNAIMLGVAFTYTVSVWYVQVKVVYMYLRVDRAVVWINLCMLAVITILPFAITTLELSISFSQPSILCVSTFVVGIFQTIHIVYSFIRNHYEQLHDDSHEKSNVIVLLFQIYSALSIPIRILFGYALWFAPVIGNDLLLIVFILCIFAPFDAVLVEKMFILTHKNIHEIAGIAFYLKYFNKQLSKERFVQFCDALFVVLAVILILEVLSIMNCDIYHFSLVSNSTENIQLHSLLASNQDYLYCLVWGMIVIFSFWLANFHMFSYIITIDRLILFLQMLSLFFLCFIPLLAVALAKYSTEENVRDLRLTILIALSIVISIGLVHFILWIYIRFGAKHLHTFPYILPQSTALADSDSFEPVNNAETIILPEMRNLFEARDPNLRLDKITTLRMVLLLVIIPSIAFVLLLTELINKNTVNVYIMFIVFLVAIPLKLFVEYFPYLVQYLMRFRRYVKQYVQARLCMV